jgi:hypothetical protein
MGQQASGASAADRCGPSRRAHSRSRGAMPSLGRQIARGNRSSRLCWMCPDGRRRHLRRRTGTQGVRGPIASSDGLFVYPCAPEPGTSGRQYCNSSAAFSRPRSSRGLPCPVRKWRSTVAMNSSSAAVALFTGVGSGLSSVIEVACHGPGFTMLPSAPDHWPAETWRARRCLGATPSLLTRRYPEGYPALFRSVRDLGLPSPAGGCACKVRVRKARPAC